MYQLKLLNQRTRRDEYQDVRTHIVYTKPESTETVMFMLESEKMK